MTTAIRQSTIKFAPVEPVPEHGFYNSWGHQAWFDLAALKWLLDYAGDIVEKTWVPIIKLSAPEPGEVDEAYAIIRQQHEKVRWNDSPREKWRKLYGNFIREIEWGCDELYKYFPKEEYQELVVSTVADVIRKWLAGITPQITRLLQEKPGKRKTAGKSRIRPELMQSITQSVFRTVNFASFMVGECHVESFDPEAREMVMKIPDCGFHRAPRMSTIPDQGCVFACKGACERVLEEETPVKLLFEPHLPDTSCTLTINW